MWFEDNDDLICKSKKHDTYGNNAEEWLVYRKKIMISFVHLGVLAIFGNVDCIWNIQCCIGRNNIMLSAMN